MATVLSKVAGALSEDVERDGFEVDQKSIVRSIHQLHWSDNDKAFCDATVHNEVEHTLVCHSGYISLFPFMLGHIDPHSEQIGHVLDMLSHSDQLWSHHGIRSLSKQDAYYGRGENYWRGSVWINLNYLILQQLLVLAQTSGRHQIRVIGMYTKLRVNLVETLYRSWAKTGSAWEHYDPETGEGQGTQQFTGWTALIAKVMAMPNLHNDASVIPEAGYESNTPRLPPFQDRYLVSISNTELFGALLLILAVVFCYGQRVLRTLCRLRDRTKFA